MRKLWKELSQKWDSTRVPIPPGDYVITCSRISEAANDD